METFGNNEQILAVLRGRGDLSAETKWTKQQGQEASTLV